MSGPVRDADEFYRGEAGQSYHREKRRVPDAGRAWIAALRREKFAARVRKEDVVVEFGVGAGWNLIDLECARRIGVDVAEFLADDLASNGIEFVADSATLASASADVVICHHMLEHVVSPAETLTEIRRVLKPTGTLLLYTPYEVERRWRHYDPNDPDHHLYSWNPQTLGALVELSGMSVADAGLGRYGYDRFAAALAVRARIGERGFRAIRRCVHAVKPVREVRVVASP